jgi:ribosomal protein L11 methyltransferase
VAIRAKPPAAKYAWRKLSAAKWEDAWWERLSEFRDRLASTALPGAKTIRLEVYSLNRAQAARLRAAFGGSVRTQKSPRTANERLDAPIRVREKLVIVGSERERSRMKKSLPSRKVLLIPARMAFGTGGHATTASCLRLLADVAEKLVEQQWEMLDLGCGSGILAFAGRLLGARRADAVDFDPHAVRTARENARANALRGVAVKRLDVRAWQPARTWDVVTANLLSGLLIEIAPKLAASVAPGGALILSGILRAQEAEVLAAFRRAGFRTVRIVRRGKWVALSAKRAAR